MIQFFSNAATDPSGYYEGQTYLGATTLMIGLSGTANFAVSLPSVVTSTTWITATTTSLTTIAPGLTSGDTSEFSGGLPAQPVSVQFVLADFTADSTAGVATIEVERLETRVPPSR